jgi:hypothetical protein
VIRDTPGTELSLMVWKGRDVPVRSDHARAQEHTLAR